MSEAVLTTLIETVPAVLWVILALVVYLTMRGPVLKRIVPRVSRISGFGMDMVLERELLDRAADTDDGDEGPHTRVTRAQRLGVLRRLDHAADLLKDGAILWVDDHPENNRYLVELFRALDMRVDLAESTSEALALLRRHSYDLCVSDIHRGTDERAGVTMVEEFRNNGIHLPVILHAARFDPRLGVDPMVFGGTNRVDEVAHYVIDIMERRRLGP